MKKVFVVPNRYMDSVTLMGIAVRLQERPEVHSADCGMGTRQNMELLREEGYTLPEDITKNDLMLALECDTEEQLKAAFDAGMSAMMSGSGNHERVYHDVSELEDHAYDVLQISLPGKYALKEAYKAVDKGMDVFMFTADVSLEEERALKEYGRDRGCLIMGPDAGVGLLGGVAMAAGSIVRRGPIGVIGASGSGSQEVACLIEDMGSGVTCILGTGGRDLKKQVGGISMKADMKRLEDDEDTKLICLVSMLADREIMEEVLCEADRLTKPVVAVFLGADEALYQRHRAVGTYNLQDAAKACLRLLTGAEPKIGWSEEELDRLAQECLCHFTGEKKYFRGLYTGGTFAEETLITFRIQAPDTLMHTNRDNTRYAVRLKTHKQSEGHTLLDMGDLDFTAEAPHTVFDPAQRLQRFHQEQADPEVGLIAMDIILGPGVAPDPASCYLPSMKERSDIVYVCAVCGGEGDPQNKALIKEKLRQAGAIVADSNYESARLCARICQKLEGK
jgi:FdrA protein